MKKVLPVLLFLRLLFAFHLLCLPQPFVQLQELFYINPRLNVRPYCKHLINVWFRQNLPIAPYVHAISQNVGILNHRFYLFDWRNLLPYAQAVHNALVAATVPLILNIEPVDLAAVAVVDTEGQQVLDKIAADPRLIRLTAKLHRNAGRDTQELVWDFVVMPDRR